MREGAAKKPRTQQGFVALVDAENLLGSPRNSPAKRDGGLVDPLGKKGNDDAEHQIDRKDSLQKKCAHTLERWLFHPCPS